MNDTESRFSLLEIDPDPTDAPVPEVATAVCPGCSEVVPAGLLDLDDGLCEECGEKLARVRAAESAPSAVAPPQVAVDPIDAFRDRMILERREGRSVAPVVREAYVATPVASVPAKHISEELVAVESTSQSTGCVTYWTLSGELDLDKLRSAWLDAGLPEDWLISNPTDTVAFTRAAKSLQDHRCLVRKHPKSGYQVVYEIAAADDSPMSYDSGPRLVLSKGALGTPSVEIFADEGANHPSAALTLETVRAAFAVAQRAVDAGDMSVWLTALAKKLKAVSLRSSGGIYFVPAGETYDRWHAAAAAVQGASAHRVFEIPALKSPGSAMAIQAAMQSELDALTERIRGEVSEGLGERAKKSRLDELDAILDKVGVFERLLGTPLKGATDTIAKLRTEVGSSVSRGLLLEVD